LKISVGYKIVVGQMPAVYYFWLFCQSKLWESRLLASHFQHRQYRNTSYTTCIEVTIANYRKTNTLIIHSTSRKASEIKKNAAQPVILHC